MPSENLLSRFLLRKKRTEYDLSTSSAQHPSGNLEIQLW